MIQVSPRTIQRIENGADPSANTLAALARIFNLTADELKSSNLRKHFRAPWDNWVKVMSALFVLLLLFIGFTVQSWLLTAFPFIIMLLAAFSVTGYSVDGGKLYIHRLGWSTTYNLEQLTLIQYEKNITMGSRRLCGNGGVFAYTGSYKNAILGKYHAYLTNLSDCLIIGFDQKKIAISPDDCSAMKQVIEEAIKKTSAHT